MREKHCSSILCLLQGVRVRHNTLDRVCAWPADVDRKQVSSSRAAAAVWLTPQPISWTGFSPRFRSDSGCSRSPSFCAIASLTMRTWSAMSCIFFAGRIRFAAPPGRLSRRESGCPVRRRDLYSAAPACPHWGRIPHTLISDPSYNLPQQGRAFSYYVFAAYRGHETTVYEQMTSRCK